MSTLTSEDERLIGTAGLICTIIGTFVAGWVMQKNWQWFIEPGFGVETPSIPICLGVMILVRSMTYQYQIGTNDAGANDKLLAAFSQILFPIFWLVLGFIVHLFL